MDEDITELIQALRNKGFTISTRVESLGDLIIAVQSSKFDADDSGGGNDDEFGDTPHTGLLMSHLRHPGDNRPRPRPRKASGPIVDFMCDGLPAKKPTKKWLQ